LFLRSNVPKIRSQFEFVSVVPVNGGAGPVAGGSHASACTDGRFQSADATMSAVMLRALTNFLFLVLLLAIPLDVAVAADCAPPTLWTMVPSDRTRWFDDSSRSTPAGQFSFGFNAAATGSIDGNVARLYIRPNSADRTKIATNAFPPYASGIYRWRVWVPKFLPDTRAGVAAFLYASPPYNDVCNATATNCHELDFEAGYGQRTWRPSTFTSDQGILLLTSQWFVSSVTFPLNVPRCSRGILPCIDFPGTGQYASLRLPITLGRWYDFSLMVRKIAGRLYEASWSVDGVTRMTAQLNMADLPQNLDVPWNIEASLETFSIYGSQLPTTFVDTFVDEVQYTPLCATTRRRVVSRR
jgi:hypothetical protein